MKYKPTRVKITLHGNNSIVSAIFFRNYRIDVRKTHTLLLEPVQNSHLSELYELQCNNTT